MSFEIGPIRPPSEAYSLLVRVTRNCPWNRCAFCPVYKGQRFSIRKVEEVKADIDEMARVAVALAQFSREEGYGGEITGQVLREASRGPALPPAPDRSPPSSRSVESMSSSRTPTPWP